MPQITLNFLLGKTEGRVLREGKNGDSDLEREGDRKGGFCPHSQWLVALTRGPGSRGGEGRPLGHLRPGQLSAVGSLLPCVPSHWEPPRQGVKRPLRLVIPSLMPATMLPAPEREKVTAVEPENVRA